MIGETLNLMRQDICNLLCVFAKSVTDGNVDPLGSAEVCSIAAKYGFQFDTVEEEISGTELLVESIQVRDLRAE